MHERRTGNGRNWAPLLLIPAAVIIAKGASRRRARWDAAGGPQAGFGFGRHGHFGPGEGTADAGSFRLPPKIEWMLETWHTRAHEKDQATETSAV